MVSSSNARTRKNVKADIQKNPKSALMDKVRGVVRADRELAFLALGLKRLGARATDTGVTFSAEELVLRDTDVFERPKLMCYVTGDLWGDCSVIQTLIRYEIEHLQYCLGEQHLQTNYLRQAASAAPEGAACLVQSSDAPGTPGPVFCVVCEIEICSIAQRRSPSLKLGAPPEKSATW